MAVQISVATPWSFGWGASTVEELAATAAKLGIHALGVADNNGLWGAVPFQKACLEQGVKPLLGMHLQVERVSAQVLALDAKGWAALCRLSTLVQKYLYGKKGQARRVCGDSSRSRFLQNCLEAERQHVGSGSFVVLSRDSGLLQALREKTGAEGLYVSMRSGVHAQKDADLAAFCRLPAVAGQAAAFATPKDYARHRLLVAMSHNVSLSGVTEAMLACPHPRQRGTARSAWLWAENAWKDGYRYFPQALQMAEELAVQVHYQVPLGKKRMPRYALSAGDDSRSCFKNLSLAQAMQLLRSFCQRGVAWRGVASDDAYMQQLERELSLIRQQDLADYFLIVADIVSWAQRQGIANCGRGSAANSLVSYLLGFTHVDPLRYGLWFDRFLNAGRTDFPDVDLDFVWDERDRVLAYVLNRYGEGRVAVLSTHVCFGARGAVRAVAKAMGLPPTEIKPVTDALPWSHGGLNLERLYAHPKVSRLPLREEPWRNILQQAVVLQGFPRHLGVHPGGVVLAPTDLTDHLPLQYARKSTEEGPLLVTQWDMGPVEESGLLKIDLLGNRGLAVIRDAKAMVQKNHGWDMEFQKISPKTDLRTRELLARGDTMGCFYIESPSMRSLLRKLRCRDFSTLVAASSIIRPGIASSGMMQAYIERHHVVQKTGEHKDVWYLHPQLRNLLSDTYGVMAYQEDVLRVAQTLAGMSAVEADGLRKAMTKKGAHQHLVSWRQSFLDGVRTFGLSRAKALELWRQVESFAGYSFCKAHSASYAEISFYSAYLRAHFPAEFMAAVLRNHGGFYASFAYVAEAMRMGLRVLRPCVNYGSAQFVGCALSLRVGLCEIQGLSAELLARILQQRKAEGIFLGMEDFVRRVRPTRDALELLVRAGALDVLPDGYCRPERMRWCALYRYDSGCRQQERLFVEPVVPRPPTAKRFSQRRLLEMEEETLGYLVSQHPLSFYGEILRAVQVVPARDLSRFVGKYVRLVGWQVTQKPLQTKEGESMAFLSFEDTTALYETVLFPEAYQRLAPWTLTRGPYVLEGRVMGEYGAYTVEVEQLWLLREYMQRLPRCAKLARQL